jgi:AcrR family transcriptional regulator
MNALVESILRLGSRDVESEEAACAALVALRFPRGIACTCGASCTRLLAIVTFTRGHSFTILIDTPFATKRRPRVRALFLAIRAFALSPRSVSAREIAREVGAPPATVWRHLLTLRALLPSPVATAPSDVAVAQLCGRHTNAQRAWVRTGARVAIERVAVERVERVAVERLDRVAVERVAAERETDDVKGGREGRLLAESIRTTLNGTFHGVSARWLAAYLDEALARWRIREEVCASLLARMVGVERALTFRAVRRRLWS